MCDTVCIVGPEGVLFGKNSDRDANEAQVLDWQPAADWPVGARVQCTEVAIPQVAHTHAVVLSRPFWMWGAEMGANEHGVVIGNEAVFTRRPVPASGLLGMDLLRLALERGDTAEGAVQTLITLLEAHGQGGRCGLEDASFRYHNSFLVADATGAWVVETSGRESATEQITAGVRTLSNTLTIPAFRRAELGLVGRVKSAVAAADTRRAHTRACLHDARGPAEVASTLRSHGGDGPQWRWHNGTLGAPCMHGGGALARSVTTGSWISHLRPGDPRHWATGTAAPCVGLYKPVRVHEPIRVGSPTDQADDSLWWRHERLHRAWLAHPDSRFLLDRDALEARWFEAPPPSDQAFAEGDALLARWTSDLRQGPDPRPAGVRRYWRARNEAAGIEVRRV